jgi:hypothetical protein
MYSNIKIVAFLSKVIALNDNWTPALDGLIAYQIMYNCGILKQNPSQDDIKTSIAVIKEKMPIEIGYLSESKSSWYYKTSSPFYEIKAKEIKEFPSASNVKPWRVTSCLTWYCRGNIQEVEDILQTMQSIGKYKTFAYSGVKSWLIQEVENDYHLWKNDKLCKPVPYVYLEKDTRIFKYDYKCREWGWRCPTALVDNQSRCVMPIHNITT